MGADWSGGEPTHLPDLPLARRAAGGPREGAGGPREPRGPREGRNACRGHRPRHPDAGTLRIPTAVCDSSRHTNAVSVSPP